MKQVSNNDDISRKILGQWYVHQTCLRAVVV
jgi:hypothetical protein